MNFRPPEELDGAFKMRPADANKRTVGTVAVVGGSERFPNAPAIAGLGARAAGAGLVQLVVPAATRAAAAALVPEATFSRLSARLSPPKADVVVVGMGLGLSDVAETTLRRLLSGEAGRFVVDADALTIVASWHLHTGGYAAAEGRELVFTPHEGEAARLLGCDAAHVKANRREAAVEIAARYGATCVLKGPNTIVVSADGRCVYENATGNPFMALGGMGDLLAGVIGARWAYLKGDAFLAAASSAWLHGAASDSIVAESGDPSLAATAARIGGMRVALDSSYSKGELK